MGTKPKNTDELEIGLFNVLDWMPPDGYTCPICGAFNDDEGWESCGCEQDVLYGKD